MTPLTPHEKRILAIAGRNYHAESSRERAVWDAFELNMTQFWAEVRVLIKTEAALAHAPLTTKRLLARLVRPVVRRPRPVDRFEGDWKSRTA